MHRAYALCLSPQYNITFGSPEDDSPTKKELSPEDDSPASVEKVWVQVSVVRAFECKMSLEPMIERHNTRVLETCRNGLEWSCHPGAYISLIHQHACVI